VEQIPKGTEPFWHVLANLCEGHPSCPQEIQKLPRHEAGDLSGCLDGRQLSFEPVRQFKPANLQIGAGLVRIYFRIASQEHETRLFDLALAKQYTIAFQFPGTQFGFCLELHPPKSLR